jgi:hypothetical protein
MLREGESCEETAGAALLAAVGIVKIGVREGAGVAVVDFGNSGAGGSVLLSLFHTILLME